MKRHPQAVEYEIAPDHACFVGGDRVRAYQVGDESVLEIGDMTILVESAPEPEPFVHKRLANGRRVIGVDSKDRQTTEHGKVTGWVLQDPPVHASGRKK